MFGKYTNCSYISSVINDDSYEQQKQNKMANLEKNEIMISFPENNEIKTMVSGIIQYCIEEYGEFIDVDTIWECVCDETDTDYNDYDCEVGIAFENLITEFNL